MNGFGNSGVGYSVGSPGVATSALTVGAVDAHDKLADPKVATNAELLTAALAYVLGFRAIPDRLAIALVSKTTTAGIGGPRGASRRRAPRAGLPTTCPNRGRAPRRCAAVAPRRIASAHRGAPPIRPRQLFHQLHDLVIRQFEDRHRVSSAGHSTREGRASAFLRWDMATSGCRHARDGESRHGEGAAIPHAANSTVFGCSDCTRGDCERFLEASRAGDIREA